MSMLLLLGIPPKLIFLISFDFYLQISVVQDDAWEAVQLTREHKPNLKDWVVQRDPQRSIDQWFFKLRMREQE